MYNYQHQQNLSLTEGSYSYSIMCCDAGSNCDEETIDFSVDSDMESPTIVRIGSDAAETSQLKLTTNEEAQCVYSITSCTYNFADGVAFTTSDSLEHYTEWDTGKDFYVKCKDQFGNQPDYDSCSVIVRPFNI